jgi:HEAT repeat protein
MATALARFSGWGTAGLLVKAIVAAVIADALLLGFILLRRAYRNRYFAERDARVFEFRRNWKALISGQIPYGTWRTNHVARQIVEDMALDAYEAAGPEESLRLLNFLRASGLVAKRIFEARNHRGWRRRQALVLLGRTRASEGIPALGEGLRDKDQETRLAALRGLGRMASPQAGQEILHWVGESGVRVPALPLQSALIQCCAERPGLLLPYIRHGDKAVREIIGRVLGEIATPAMGEDLLEFAGDDLDELRAAVARALSHARSDLELETLGELARDAVWFVRLRAVVSLGKLQAPSAIPFLLRGLTDSNRLVRLRAAEALMNFQTEMTAVFRQAIALQDLYGLHAYLTALENAGLEKQLEAELESARWTDKEEAEKLLNVLHTRKLPVELPGLAQHAPLRTAARP